MLIPYLDRCPEKSARYCNNSHIIKLPTEAFQCLSAALYILDKDSYTKYTGKHTRAAFSGHPFAVWIAGSEAAWDWVMQFATSACVEYAKRYSENITLAHPRHGTLARLEEISKFKPVYPDSSKCWVDPPLPKMARRIQGATRVIEFRWYFIDFKTKAGWRFAYEPRARQPRFITHPLDCD